MVVLIRPASAAPYRSCRDRRFAAMLDALAKQHKHKLNWHTRSLL